MTTPEPPLPAWAKRSATGEEFSDERLALLVGPRWMTYRRKFAAFRDDPSFVPTWNWAAALFSPAWFLYRKLYLAFALFFLGYSYAFAVMAGPDAASLTTLSEMMKPENSRLLQLKTALQLSLMIAAGGTANWLLYRRVRAASRVVDAQALPPAETQSLLRRFGGVNTTALAVLLAISAVLTLAQIRA